MMPPVADLDPNKKRIAQHLRMLGSSGGERRNAFALLEQLMRSKGISWSDIGNMIEHGSAGWDDGKYTETEMLEFAQAARAEGVEAGIQIGLARASNSGGGGRGVLPPPAIMAEYCHQQLGRLKNDWQRDFVADIFVITRHTMNLSRPRLANLAKIYIEIGGKI
jgi:hypothetical protein